MPKPDSDTVHDAYGDTLAKLYANLFEAYVVGHAPDPAADKKFAVGLKLARQARESAIKIVAAP
jgi:hypothetical protein